MREKAREKAKKRKKGTNKIGGKTIKHLFLKRKSELIYEERVKSNFLNDICLLQKEKEKKKKGKDVREEAFN